MIDLKYSQILDLNNKIGLDNNIAPYKIALLSNIIIHQSKDVLEYYFRSQNVGDRSKLKS